MGDLSRHEAIEAIQRHLGNTEETALVIDWVYEMWETMGELYKRLGPELARHVIEAQTPTFDEPPHHQVQPQ